MKFERGQIKTNINARERHQFENSVRGPYKQVQITNKSHSHNESQMKRSQFHLDYLSHHKTKAMVIIVRAVYCKFPFAIRENGIW